MQHILYRNRRWSFFFNDTATTEIYTLSLHDALPLPLPELALDGVEERVVLLLDGEVPVAGHAEAVGGADDVAREEVGEVHADDVPEHEEVVLALGGGEADEAVEGARDLDDAEVL